MAKKIIAYVSKFQGRDGVTVPLTDSRRQNYYYPNNETDSEGNRKFVRGTQTNEAPILYLLENERNIHQVMCICSVKARQKVTAHYSSETETEELSPYEYLKQSILNHPITKERHPNLQFVEIPFNDEAEDGKEAETFESGPMPRILSEIGQKDIIFLETTGGLRPAATQLLLLSRLLRYKGVKLRQAVYSEFNFNSDNFIHDVTHHYLTFDLINGMNEFQNFFNATTIRKYYDGQQKPSEVDAMLTTFENLSDSLTLCQVNNVEKQLQDCKDSIETVRKNNTDPVLYELLTIFEDRFNDMSSSMPKLIRWCLKNNMIQQALTLWSDRMPKYFIEEKKLIIIPDSAKQEYKAKKNANKTRDEKNNYLLNWCFFAQLGEVAEDNQMCDPEKFDLRTYVALNLEKVLAKQTDEDCYRISSAVKASTMGTILLDYLYLRTIRNQTNHSGEDNSMPKLRVRSLRSQKRVKYYFDMKLEHIVDSMTVALNRLNSVS